MFEVEKKAWLDKPIEILEKLKLSRYEYKGFFHKQDIYFSSSQIICYEDIKKQKYIIRVRLINGVFFLTLKFKKLVQNTEVNREIEVEVSLENKEKILDFFYELNINLTPLQVQSIYTLNSNEEWIEFWKGLGFYRLLNKEKKTELFQTKKNNFSISIEWNELVSLGFFLEVEGLTEKEEEIADLIECISEIISSLGIPSSKEEPKLYLELLFQQKNSC